MGEQGDNREVEPYVMVGQHTTTRLGNEVKRYATDKKLPNWRRLEFYALGRMRKNGHASFEQGEIAEILGIRSVDVMRVIRDGVEMYAFDPSSHSRCVVLPSHIQGGRFGSVDEVCRSCERRATARERYEQRRRREAAESA